MEITLDNIGKRFNRDWIFRGISTQLKLNHHTVLLGSNGSGKSTLLQILSGYMEPSEGKLEFTKAQEIVVQEDTFRHVSLTSPALKLYEELTLREMFDFHSKFKKLRGNLSPDQLIDKTGLNRHRDKQLKNFSSGMLQRVKLAQAILSDSSLLLLDEPTSNLDRQGIEWYKDLIEENKQDRLIIVCSNRQRDEYDFCSNSIDIEEYKKPHLAG
jgi:ABC-type multidrug transport system ATPase subunit